MKKKLRSIRTVSRASSVKRSEVASAVKAVTASRTVRIARKPSRSSAQ